MKAQGPPRSSEPARGAPALPSSRRNCPARSRPEAAPGGSGKDSASRQSWRRRPGSFLTCEPTINYSPGSSSGSSEPAPPNPNQLLLRLPRAHSQCSRAVGGFGGRSLLSPGRLLGVFRVLELLPSRRRPGGRQRGQVGLGPGFPKSCKSIPWGASGEEPPSAAASGASPSRISLEPRGMCRETSPHLSPGIKKPQIPVFPADLISGSPLGALPEPGPSRDGGTGAGLEDGAGNWLLCPQERELMPGTGAPECSRSSRSPSAPGCLP